MKSPKSCLLGPWLTFLVTECLEILLPSITKLVNCSLSEDVVSHWFQKKTVVTPLIKKALLPPDDFNYQPVSGLCFINQSAVFHIINHDTLLDFLNPWFGVGGVI